MYRYLVTRSMARCSDGGMVVNRDGLFADEEELLSLVQDGMCREDVSEWLQKPIHIVFQFAMAHRNWTWKRELEPFHKALDNLENQDTLVGEIAQWLPDTEAAAEDKSACPLLIALVKAAGGIDYSVGPEAHRRQFGTTWHTVPELPAEYADLRGNVAQESLCDALKGLEEELLLVLADCMEDETLCEWLGEPTRLAGNQSLLHSLLITTGGLPTEIDAFHMGGHDTLLHLAASTGHFHIVSFLVREYHTEVDHPDAEGVTVLQHAVMNGDRAGVRSLLQVGARLENSTRVQSSPLFLAVERICAKILCVFLDQGHTNPNAVDESGRSLLHTAYLNDSDDCAVDLLERGAQEGNPPPNTGQLQLSQIENGARKAMKNCRWRRRRKPLLSVLRFQQLQQLKKGNEMACPGCSEAQGKSCKRNRQEEGQDTSEGSNSSDLRERKVARNNEITLHPLNSNGKSSKRLRDDGDQVISGKEDLGGFVCRRRLTRRGGSQ
ncbi:unnamed protein product, partial [Choristocarpus tenellus]